MADSHSLGYHPKRLTNIEMRVKSEFPFGTDYTCLTESDIFPILEHEAFPIKARLRIDTV